MAETFPQGSFSLSAVSSVQIPVLRPLKYMAISKRQKTVSRAYGGTLCAACVRQRIVRAFLVEERKIVKKLFKKSAEAAKDSKK